MCSSLFSLTVGTSSLKQAQALPPSSPQLLLATLWQQAQCTPLLPGRYLGILYPVQPSSSRNPPSTAHGGKMNFSPYCPSVRKSTCKHTLWLYSEFQEFGEMLANKLELDHSWANLATGVCSSDEWEKHTAHFASCLFQELSQRAQREAVLPDPHNWSDFSFVLIEITFDQFLGHLIN